MWNVHFSLVYGMIFFYHGLVFYFFSFVLDIDELRITFRMEQTIVFGHCDLPVRITEDSHRTSHTAGASWDQSPVAWGSRLGLGLAGWLGTGPSCWFSLRGLLSLSGLDSTA